jgi:hypothetical protein
MLEKVAGLAVLVLLNSSTAFAAAGGCHAISGSYVQSFVPCATPAIACVHAETTGDLAGISDTTITAFDPVTHTFSGGVRIVRDNGAVITATIEKVRENNFGTETFTGGTRQYAHATGTLVATGGSTGTYSGEICLGGGDGTDD